MNLCPQMFYWMQFDRNLVGNANSRYLGRKSKETKVGSWFQVFKLKKAFD